MSSEKDGGREQHPERLGEKDGVFRSCDDCGERRNLFVVDGDHLCAECLED